ncbi:MAG: molecular chaperone TorD family protein [Nitrospiraceae bacterium]|nr:molecular chaperone TorD family protein [Nitrospiraceae bacterium]
MDTQAFEELGFNRKLTYDVLSELFSKRPDEALLRKLNKEGLLAFLGGFCKCEETTGKLKLIVERLLSDKAGIKKLCGEFEEIFLIPVADTYVPPVASAFMGDDVQSGSFGTILEELTATYRAYGVKFINNKEDVFVFHPDHVASLFNFMSFLIEREQYYRERGASDLFNDVVYREKSFFERFIRSWINYYLSEMHEKASSDFYKLVAAFTQNFISGECRF